jgi:hypothetical protein
MRMSHEEYKNASKRQKEAYDRTDKLAPIFTSRRSLKANRLQ